MAKEIKRHVLSDRSYSKVDTEPVDDIQTPQGTLLVTFLFLLLMAVIWGYMYFSLLQQA